MAYGKIIPAIFNKRRLSPSFYFYLIEIDYRIFEYYTIKEVKSMDYKIGNQVSTIVRNYRVSDDTSLENHAPYTVLGAKECKISFKDQTTSASHLNRVDLFFNNRIVNEVQLFSVPLTEKVLSMCFQEEESLPCAEYEESTIRNNKLILKKRKNAYYNIYVYGLDNTLIYSSAESSSPVLNIEHDDVAVFVFYEYLDNAFVLNKPENHYVTIDMITLGNNDDQTAKMRMHFEKCGYVVNNDLSFNKTGDTVNLTFKVIATEKDYIIFED